MGAKLISPGLIMFISLYLRSAMVRFPLYFLWYIFGPNTSTYLRECDQYPYTEQYVFFLLLISHNLTAILPVCQIAQCPKIGFIRICLVSVLIPIHLEQFSGLQNAEFSLCEFSWYVAVSSYFSEISTFTLRKKVLPQYFGTISLPDKHYPQN